jgi:carbon storage regulator
MLVLSRKEGEQIVLDEDIVVKVIHIKGHRVRLGIEAPQAKRILRKEIAKRMLPPEPSHPGSNGPQHRLRQPSIGDGGRVDVDTGK